jgi:SAM-dependent methyltransferase
MIENEWSPDRLIQVSGSYWMSCALHAGVKLDVFTAIGEDNRSGQEIAREISGDQRGVCMLLNALAAMNLLIKENEQYANTDFGKTFLSKDSPRYMGYMILHHHHLIGGWSKLSEAVTAGAPVKTRISFEDETVRESFLMGMFNLASNLAPRLVPKIDLTGRRHLLDLGGGPGTYAIHFCLQNKDLEATVFDLPTSRKYAEKTIDKFDIGKRVRFMSGNFLEDDLVGDFDAAWLSHILHGEGPENVQEIINNATSSLKRGGLIIIHEFILDDTMDGPLFAALFSLNMLMGTERGRSYSENQLTYMLSRAGVKDIQRLPLDASFTSGIITGVV